MCTLLFMVFFPSIFFNIAAIGSMIDTEIELGQTKVQQVWEAMLSQTVCFSDCFVL